MEGRAIGTVVVPDADVKVFLTCDPAERVRCRAKDGNNETEDELLKRDRQDSERAEAPLRKADDAIEIDTTSLTSEQVVELIISRLPS
jgi:cytidylate kinase